MMIDVLLRQRCTVRPWLRTEGGADVYGAEQERKCRVQTGLRLENGAGGTDTVAARAMMFCTGEMIPERSQVVCEGRTYIVLACREAQGFAQTHLEVTME